MVIICAICKRLVGPDETASDFGADSHGRLWLKGLCVACFHDPASAGASLFEPGIDVPALEEPAEIAY